MKRLRSLIVFGALCTAAAPFASAAPQRSKGISIHMLPKRVADLDGKRWGLVVSYAPYQKPEAEEPVLQSAAEVLAFTRKQTPTVQANGVWIVTTHPNAYSDQEKRVLEDVKAAFRREHIPVFVARGSELPNGWQRFDRLP